MAVWIVWYTTHHGDDNIWMVCGTKEKADEERNAAEKMGFTSWVNREEVFY